MPRKKYVQPSLLETPVEITVDESCPMFGQDFDWESYKKRAYLEHASRERWELEDLLVMGQTALKNIRHSRELIRFFTTLNEAVTDQLAERHDVF